VREAENGIQALEAFVEFWGNYIPDIYGLAKALLISRDDDEAAAAAWDDRMDAVYQGCVRVVQQLESEGLLSPEWSVDEAADFFWAAFSVASWENLTIECGWSNDQFIERIQMVLKKALLRPTN
jgi:hypothetical protein